MRLRVEHGLILLKHLIFHSLRKKKKKKKKKPSDCTFGCSYSVTKWIKSCLLPCFGTFKMPFLMFISTFVSSRRSNLEPSKARHKELRILNASGISKNQLNSSTISPS